MGRLRNSFIPGGNSPYPSSMLQEVDMCDMRGLLNCKYYRAFPIIDYSYYKQVSIHRQCVGKQSEPHSLYTIMQLPELFTGEAILIMLSPLCAWDKLLNLIYNVYNYHPNN